MVAATAGYPLALALLADVAVQNPGTVQNEAAVQQGAAGQQEAAGQNEARAARPPVEAALGSAELVEALLARFVGDVTDAGHRRALQLLGHVRVTTQALLTDVLADAPAPTAGATGADAQECFDWLRGLSFVQVSRSGLAPHDLARTVLDADLRWRDPDGWRSLRATARESYLRQARQGEPGARRRAVADLLWLNRTSPNLRAYPSWDDAFSLWWEPARPRDLPEILALVAQHEGEQSVELHEGCWAAQPEAFVVIRERPGQVHGFFVQPRVDADARFDDPFVAAALAHVAATAPLRPGEHLRVLRSWIGVDGYHVPSPTQQALTGATTAAWLSEPGLAVSVSYMNAGGDDDPWAPMFAHVDYQRAEGADVEATAFAGPPRRFRAFLHDWRVRPPLEWLALITERADSATPPDLDQPGPRLAGPAAPGGRTVLTRAQFDQCVRAALKNATDARALGASPLLGCRVVRDRIASEPARAAGAVGAGGAVGAVGAGGAADLRAVITDAVARLRTRPRGEREARVLEVTFFARAATQEAAAARLSLPFSTYRRALASGLTAVLDDLWDRELHGS